MIYLANNEIIKHPEILQDLPALNTPVLSDIETGATIVLGTQLSVSNMPTGGTLYVNGSAVQGSTFTITPDASASTRNYLYTINLQFKGVSGYVDSEIASYTFNMKNAAPTVNQNSQVTTSASLTVAISRTDTTYVTDLDVKYGGGTDTTTGNSGTSVTISDTSVNSQYNFWINSTAYADKSDVVTKYYHVAGSEQLPSCTISYNENDENFTLNIASFPSDPDNGNYMSSTGYTIYYSLNSETIDTQYNNIAVSCNAGDTIRAQVSSSYGWLASEVASYSVPVPVVTTPQLGDGFDGFYALSNNASFQYSPTNGTYIQYLGSEGDNTYWTDASEQLVLIYDSAIASAVTTAGLVSGQYVDPNGFTATKKIYRENHQLQSVSGLSFASEYIDIDDGNIYVDDTLENLTATSLALSDIDTAHYTGHNEYYKLTNVKLVDNESSTTNPIVAYDVNQNACLVYDQLSIMPNYTINYENTQYDIYGFLITYRGMVQFMPVIIEQSATQNSAFASQYNVTVLNGYDLYGQDLVDYNQLVTRQLSTVGVYDNGLETNAVKFGNNTQGLVFYGHVTKVVVVDSNYSSVANSSRNMTISDGENSANLTKGSLGSCTFTASNINFESFSIANATSTQISALAIIVVESYSSYSLQPVWYDKVAGTWYETYETNHNANAGLYWFDEAPNANCCIACMVRDNTGAPYEPSNSARIDTTGGSTTRWTYGWYYDKTNVPEPGTGIDSSTGWGEGGIEVSNVDGNGADTITTGYRYGATNKYNPKLFDQNGNDIIWTDTIDGTNIYYKLFDITLTGRLIYDSNKSGKPSSITITSSNTSVITVANNGRYLTFVDYGESTITCTYTVNSVTYTTTMSAFAEEVNNNELWFPGFEEGVEDMVGNSFEAPLYYGTPGDDENEVNDSENCALYSDDESIATVEWYDQNEGEDEPLYVPKITCVGEGETNIIAEYEGLIAMFVVTVTAAE